MGYLINVKATDSEGVTADKKSGDYRSSEHGAYGSVRVMTYRISRSVPRRTRSRWAIFGQVCLLL